AVQAISPEVIVAQVTAVVEDIGVDAVKIGMLGTVATIEAVAASLEVLAPGTPGVLDPVMVSESGAAVVGAPAGGAWMRRRYPGGAAHGSGCTHSSVLAARLAWGDSPLEAARVAKRRASEAVRDGLRGVGAGAGPVNVLGVT